MSSVSVLVIRDQLVTPPTWFASFRDLTMFCHVFLHLDIVLESDDDPTPYYRWIKGRGGMDFVKEFVRTGSQEGIFLDCELRLARPGPVILTDRIAIENIHSLLGKIQAAKSIAT